MKTLSLLTLNLGLSLGSCASTSNLAPSQPAPVSAPVLKQDPQPNHERLAWNYIQTVYESLRKENPPSLARESPQLLTRKCVNQTEDHSLSSLCTHLVLLQRLQTREREEQLELYRLRMKQTVWEHAWNYIR